MNAVDRLALLANLEEECCELNHGPDTGHLKIPAVDYIIQPFGYSASEIEEVAVRELVVPVCSDCASALQGNEWTLVYCFECCSSQWIYRRYAKNQYRHHILWLRGCPKCTYEFGGLYFSDLKALVDYPLFLSRIGDIAAA